MNALVRGRAARSALPASPLILAGGRQHTAETLPKAWRESKSPHTIAAYASDLEEFAVFISRALAISPVLKVPEALTWFFKQGTASAHETVLHFRAHLEKAGMAPSSINRHIACLRSLTALGRMLGVSDFRIEIPGVKTEPRRDTRGPEPATISFQRVRIEQASPFRREGQPALAIAQINRLNEPLIVEVLKGVVGKIEIVFRHDAKRTDSSQQKAVIAVELVDPLAINNQLPLVAARQVEVAHQGVPRIVVPVARVVHALPFVAAIPNVVFAWIIPSSVGHRSSLRWCCSWFVREDALAVAAKGGSGRRRSAGAWRCGVQAWSVANHCSGR